MCLIFIVTSVSALGTLTQEKVYSYEKLQEDAKIYSDYKIEDGRLILNVDEKGLLILPSYKFSLFLCFNDLVIFKDEDMIKTSSSSSLKLKECDDYGGYGHIIYDNEGISKFNSNLELGFEGTGYLLIGSGTEIIKVEGTNIIQYTDNDFIVNFEIKKNVNGSWISISPLINITYNKVSDKYKFSWQDVNLSGSNQTRIFVTGNKDIDYNGLELRRDNINFDFHDVASQYPTEIIRENSKLYYVEMQINGAFGLVDIDPAVYENGYINITGTGNTPHSVFDDIGSPTIQNLSTAPNPCIYSFNNDTQVWGELDLSDCEVWFNSTPTDKITLDVYGNLTSDNANLTNGNAHLEQWKFNINAGGNLSLTNSEINQLGENGLNLKQGTAEGILIDNNEFTTNEVYNFISLLRIENNYSIIQNNNFTDLEERVANCGDLAQCNTNYGIITNNANHNKIHMNDFDKILGQETNNTAFGLGGSGGDVYFLQLQSSDNNNSIIYNSFFNLTGGYGMLGNGSGGYVAGTGSNYNFSHNLFEFQSDNGLDLGNNNFIYNNTLFTNAGDFEIRNNNTAFDMDLGNNNFYVTGDNNAVYNLSTDSGEIGFNDIGTSPTNNILSNITLYNSATFASRANPQISNNIVEDVILYGGYYEEQAGSQTGNIFRRWEFKSDPATDCFTFTDGLGTGSNYLIDINASQCSQLISIETDTDKNFYLINVTSSGTETFSGESDTYIYRQWYAEYFTNDTNGLELNNASINVTNSSGALSHSGYTNANGYLSFNITEYSRNDTIENYENNYTSNATYQNINLTDNRNFTANQYIVFNFTLPYYINITYPENSTYFGFYAIDLDLNVTSNTLVNQWWYNVNGTSNVTFTPNTTLEGLSADESYFLKVYGNTTAELLDANVTFYIVNGERPQPYGIIFSILLMACLYGFLGFQLLYQNKVRPLGIFFLSMAFMFILFTARASAVYAQEFSESASLISTQNLYFQIFLYVMIVIIFIFMAFLTASILKWFGDTAKRGIEQQNV